MLILYISTFPCHHHGLPHVGTYITYKETVVMYTFAILIVRLLFVIKIIKDVMYLY
jgi:hypothetical protein